MMTGEVVNATDWPLVGATALGGIAVLIAAIIAAIYASKYSARQDRAQYREGLNKQRREAYPALFEWAVSAEDAANGLAQSPGPVENAQLWCCASPDLLHALKELSCAWGSFSAAPTQRGSEETENAYKKRIKVLISGVRRQARWDLFGRDAFEYDDWQKVKPDGQGAKVITYTVDEWPLPAQAPRPPAPPPPGGRLAPGRALHP